jgi:hypothetical protein
MVGTRSTASHYCRKRFGTLWKASLPFLESVPEVAAKLKEPNKKAGLTRRRGERKGSRSGDSAKSKTSARLRVLCALCVNLDQSLLTSAATSSEMRVRSQAEVLVLAMTSSGAFELAFVGTFRNTPVSVNPDA